MLCAQGTAVHLAYTLGNWAECPGYLVYIQGLGATRIIIRSCGWTGMNGHRPTHVVLLPRPIGVCACSFAGAEVEGREALKGPIFRVDEEETGASLGPELAPLP